MQCLCQYISMLIRIQNMMKKDESSLDLITNRMTVNLYVFFPLMEDRVLAMCIVDLLSQKSLA